MGRHKKTNHPTVLPHFKSPFVQHYHFTLILSSFSSSLSDALLYSLFPSFHLYLSLSPSLLNQTTQNESAEQTQARFLKPKAGPSPQRAAVSLERTRPREVERSNAAGREMGKNEATHERYEEVEAKENRRKMNGKLSTGKVHGDERNRETLGIVRKQTT